MAELEPTPPPADPFPNLTILDLDQLKPTPELWPLRMLQSLWPGQPIVVLAEVVERTEEGAPLLVRIIP